MNYYQYYFPYQPYVPIKNHYFKNIFKNANLNNILNGTQRTLNIVNQAIPLIKKATPIINNTKTMFKLMNEMKNINEPTKYSNNEIKKEVISNKPTFFQ